MQQTTETPTFNMKAVVQETGLKPDTIQYFDVFHQCDGCGQVFWKGSHFERLKGLVDEVLG